MFRILAKPGLSVLTVIIAGLLWVGCEGDRPYSADQSDLELAVSRDGSEPQTPSEPTAEEGFDADHLAHEQFLNLSYSLLKHGNLDTDERARLKSIHEKHPGIREVTDSLQRTLLAVEDWDGLIEMFARLPPDQVDLPLQASVQMRANRFEDAANLLLANRDRLDDPDIAWLLGYSLYHAGRQIEAVEILEPLAARVSDQRLLDVLSLAGIAYSQLDDLDRAEMMFERALAEDANHLSSLVNLATVLNRTGKTERAQELDRRALQLRLVQVRDEAKALRLSSLTRQFAEAWDARHLDRCRQLIEQMLPDADAELTAKLQAYQAEIERLSP